MRRRCKASAHYYLTQRIQLFIIRDLSTDAILHPNFTEALI